MATVINAMLFTSDCLFARDISMLVSATAVQ